MATFGQALPPKDIKFAPLNKTQEYDGPAMMALFKVRFTGCLLRVRRQVVDSSDACAGGQAPQQVPAHHRELARVPHHLLEHPSSS